MNKNLFIIILLAIFSFGFFFLKNQSAKKQVTDFKKVEEEISKKTGIKEGKPNLPSYPKAGIDKDKCGKDAFYIEEKSADFVKNYCKFLQKNGWKLVHQDYKDCEDIKSFGGGYNYEKGEEKIAVSVIRYGNDATCFWVFKRN